MREDGSNPHGGRTAIPVTRARTRVSDPDAGVAVVKNLVIDHRAQITVSAPSRLRVQVQSVDADGLGADLLRFSGIGYEAEGEPSDVLTAAVLVAGGGALNTPKQRLALAAVGVCLAPMDASWETSLHDPVYMVIRISPSEIVEHAAEMCDLDQPLRFHGTAPVSGSERLWKDTATLLYRQLIETGTQEIDPLVLHGFNRLTATTLLTVFPNTTMTAPYIPGPGYAIPARSAARGCLHRRSCRRAADAGAHCR